MTARLLEEASDRCEKILIFSSSTAGYPPLTRPVREEDMWTAPPAPVYFGYGWMRRYFELLGEYVGAVSPLKVIFAVRPQYTADMMTPAILSRRLSARISR